LGYDVFLVTDHMGKQLAPIPALMAAADATTRLRVGSIVFANDFRNPVMLAKEIATLDVLSEGRVEVGIGAGWSTTDYQQLGIPYDAPPLRVSRLEESVRLLKRLLSEESVDHTGKHYTVRAAESAQLRRAANGIARNPFVLYGSRSSLRELLIERRERLGISYISVPGNAMRDFAPIVAELRGT